MRDLTGKQADVLALVEASLTGATAAEIEEQLDKPRGWALPTLKRLARLRIIEQREENGPIVSGYRFHRRA